MNILVLAAGLGLINRALSYVGPATAALAPYSLPAAPMVSAEAQVYPIPYLGLSLAGGIGVGVKETQLGQVFIGPRARVSIWRFELGLKAGWDYQHFTFSPEPLHALSLRQHALAAVGDAQFKILDWLRVRVEGGAGYVLAGAPTLPGVRTDARFWAVGGGVLFELGKGFNAQAQAHYRRMIAQGSGASGVENSITDA